MIHERDRQTDGRTDTAWRRRPRLCIASRGKNDITFWLIFGLSPNLGLSDSLRERLIQKVKWPDIWDGLNLKPLHAIRWHRQNFRKRSVVEIFTLFPKRWTRLDIVLRSNTLETIVCSVLVNSQRCHATFTAAASVIAIGCRAYCIVVFCRISTQPDVLLSSVNIAK